MDSTITGLSANSTDIYPDKAQSDSIPARSAISTAASKTAGSEAAALLSAAELAEQASSAPVPGSTNPLYGFLRELLGLIADLLRNVISTMKDYEAAAAEDPAASAGEAKAKAAKTDSENAASGSLASSTKAESAKPSSTKETAEKKTEEQTPAEEKPKKEKSEANSLQAVTDDAGKPSVLTGDGYTISCETKEQAWLITSPDGRSTRIWGDPHVVESDGDKWDFNERSTFFFGKNKVTVETTPHANGTTVTSKITVYNGEERITICDIDKDKPRITAAASDAALHDAALSDGTIYRLTKEAKTGDDEWKKDKAKK